MKKFYKKTSPLVQREPAGTAKPKDIVILNAVKNLSGKTDSSPIGIFAKNAYKAQNDTYRRSAVLIREKPVLACYFPLIVRKKTQTYASMTAFFNFSKAKNS